MAGYVAVVNKNLFDRFFSFWILVCCLPLLFLPKINLLSIASRESAGIRIDDVVLLILSLIMFWGHFVLKKRLHNLEYWIIGLTLFSLLSYSINQLFMTLNFIHVSGSIFYCFRVLEYFMFFYLGALSTQFFKTSTLVKALFTWNLLLMLLQRGELIGQFSIIGYQAFASDRVTGIASFPSEAGLLLCMLFCYLIFEIKHFSTFEITLPKALRLFIEKTYIYWLFLICVTLVIFTGSRIAIMALIVAFFFRVINQLKQASFISWLIALLFTGIAAVVILLTIMNTDSVFTRSAKLVSFRNIDLIEKVWASIDVAQDPIGRESVRNQNYDTSWWIRIHKWCYALKIYLTHPESYLSGIGPGFAMAALDGGFLRILTEYGVIGCFLFWKIFSHIYHTSRQLKWVVIVFLINMAFFDAYLAYKPMSLLFFLTGSALMNQQD